MFVELMRYLSTDLSKLTFDCLLQYTTRIHQHFQIENIVRLDCSIMASFLVILLLNCLLSHLVATYTEDAAAAIIHLPLFRRGNRFSRREPVNMTHLAEVLQAVEAKYAPSYREVQGNRLVRRWRVNDNGDENDPHLIDIAGHLDRW